MQPNQDLINALTPLFNCGEFIEATFSGVRKKSLMTYNKLHIRAIKIKSEQQLQFAYYYDKKVIHENCQYSEGINILAKLLTGYFKQGLVYTIKADYHLLSSKRGNLKVHKKPATKSEVKTAHNIKKQYILEDGKVYDFLVALDIMSQSGKVKKSKYAKFRQINKYLEILEDTIKDVKFNDVVKIVDFGCGKAYLTFAMYYYLKEVKKYDVDIVGLDLKADVITHLNDLNKKIGYDKLQFIVGDIATFKCANSRLALFLIHITVKRFSKIAF